MRGKWSSCQRDQQPDDWTMIGPANMIFTQTETHMPVELSMFNFAGGSTDNDSTESNVEVIGVLDSI